MTPEGWRGVLDKGQRQAGPEHPGRLVLFQMEEELGRQWWDLGKRQ